MTEIDDWFGTVGFGVCATGQACFSGPAVAVLACNLDGAGYRKIRAPSSLGSLEQGQTPEFMAGLGIVHGDPRNPELQPLSSSWRTTTGYISSVVCRLASTHCLRSLV